MKIWNENMNRKLALEILQWRYSKPYDFYNNDATEENLQELLDGSYSVLVNEAGDLIGFYCTGAAAQVPKGYEVGAYMEERIDIGIGMNPSLTGQGEGFNFFSRILEIIREKNIGVPLRLTVADFNHRAIHLYEKMGFVKGIEFTAKTATFITMVKE